jgi:predicted anti-sigma-YlaC factor YlaD
VEERNIKKRFKVIEEKWLKESPEKINTLGSVMSVYRNLRENYEFRLRYDEAGEFFIREMELKRNYREVLSPDSSKTIVKQNRWPRRNLSLTGLYYHLSRYVEDLLRPTLIGVAIVFGSSSFWLTQSNPYLAPTLFSITNTSNNVTGNLTSFSKIYRF